MRDGGREGEREERCGEGREGEGERNMQRKGEERERKTRGRKGGREEWGGRLGGKSGEGGWEAMGWRGIEEHRKNRKEE